MIAGAVFLIIQSLEIGAHGAIAQHLQAIRYDSIAECQQGMLRINSKLSEGARSRLLRPMFCSKTKPAWWVELT